MGAPIRPIATTGPAHALRLHARAAKAGMACRYGNMAGKARSLGAAATKGTGASAKGIRGRIRAAWMQRRLRELRQGRKVDVDAYEAAVNEAMRQIGEFLTMWARGV